MPKVSKSLHMNLKQLLSDTQPLQLTLLSKATLHSALHREVVEMPSQEASTLGASKFA